MGTKSVISKAIISPPTFTVSAELKSLKSKKKKCPAAEVLKKQKEELKIMLTYSSQSPSVVTMSSASDFASRAA